MVIVPSVNDPGDTNEPNEPVEVAEPLMFPPISIAELAPIVKAVLVPTAALLENFKYPLSL